MITQRIDFKGIFMCIITASIIWFFHALNKTYTAVVQYPLEVGVKQTNVVPVLAPPNSIAVKVMGEGWAILRTNLRLGITPLKIEIQNPMHIRDIHVPDFLLTLQNNLKDLKVLSFPKENIHFQYDPLVSKDVHIRVHKPDIPLKEGYHITSDIHIEPKLINFKGAKTLVDKLADTLYINITDKTIHADYTKGVKLVVPSHLHLEPSQSEVTVSFTVAPFVKNTKLLPITLWHFPQDSVAYIKDNMALLQYELPENLPSSLLPDTTHIVVDFHRIDWKDSTIKPFTHRLPAFVVATVISPSKFKVHFRKRHK
jgi:hypothetical protein